LYEQVFKTFEYFCVNPDGHTLQGWRLVETRYVPLQPNEHGWLWSESLQLWLGFQLGNFQGTVDRWIRFFESSGRLVPVSGEVAGVERERAEAERMRAEAERERAEVERVRAEAERERAEVERERAEAAEAENARMRAELERLRRG
jgi:hypothetical protein